METGKDINSGSVPQPLPWEGPSVCVCSTTTFLGGCARACVCVCVYIYIYIYIYMCVCVRVCLLWMIWTASSGSVSRWEWNSGLCEHEGGIVSGEIWSRHPWFATSNLFFPVYWHQLRWHRGLPLHLVVWMRNYTLIVMSCPEPGLFSCKPWWTGLGCIFLLWEQPFENRLFEGLNQTKPDHVEGFDGTILLSRKQVYLELRRGFATATSSQGATRQVLCHCMFSAQYRFAVVLVSLQTCHLETSTWPRKRIVLHCPAIFHPRTYLRQSRNSLSWSWLPALDQILMQTCDAADASAIGISATSLSSWTIRAYQPKACLLSCGRKGMIVSAPFLFHKSVQQQ